MTANLRASVGALVWLVFAGVRARHPAEPGWVHAMLLFAALVLVPLVLELFAEDEDEPRAARLLGVARMAQLPAALLLAIALRLPAGSAAALLALPWVALTGVLAAIGGLRVRHGGLRRPLDRLCADAALIFAAIGGAWTLADRAGYRPLDFDAAIVALTAMHFHYAGLLLPLFAGLVQRELFFLRLASRAAVGVVLGVPAVALGITATQLGWGPSLEAAAGCGLALAGMVTAIMQVRIATETRRPVLTRVLLGVSGASLFTGMVFAAAYALRGVAAPLAGIGIPQMQVIHGTVNALGFGLCGVLGWRSMLR